ncbi:MAG: metallophosphoesterase family protein [Oscillospiraceae bacterium]|nr:metallophosphoesterase family protein [Oscillospiraceae bacterium]
MKKLMLVLFGLLALCAVFLAQQTNSLKTARYAWESPRVPPGFDGYRIALVSDLHNKRFGKHQARLVRAVRDLEPDLIALTGDFADLETKDLGAAREFLEGVKGLAPMYWVDGNHDPNSPFYGELRALLASCGVISLDGERVTLARGGDTMSLAGYPYWELHHPILPADIMLYHGPDEFPRFAALGCGLVLSGHNHGGQVATPWGRALIGPNHNLFPRYSGGVYTEGGSAMALSRGLGTTRVHVRAFARPEVVGVTLISKSDIRART